MKMLHKLLDSLFNGFHINIIIVYLFIYLFVIA